jgi:thioredoxin-related protein
MARMRPFLAPIAASIVLLLSNSPLRAQEINWRHDFAAARREAQETGRPMFLDFGTQACVYCQQLDATTFRVPAIAKLINDSFIPVHIDANRERVLTNSMGIHSFPTLVVLDPSGRTIDRREGFCEANTMAGFLEQGKRIASAAPRPQFRAQTREDRIPARALAIEEPAHPSQPARAEEQVAARQEMLRLPSPEELGIGAEKAAPTRETKMIDWSALHARLDRLGASSFLVQRPSAQIVRIISMFPVSENRVHRIEASATTEAEAVRLFLEQVDEWATHP